MSILVPFWSQVWAILRKDLLYEVRSKQTWIGLGMFALLILVIFNFTYDLRADSALVVAPGALWVAFIFVSLLGLGRTVMNEREVGSLDRLLMTPVDRKAIYLAKLSGNVLSIGVIEIVALPIFLLLFSLPLLSIRDLLQLVAIALLGALGIAAIGTLFAVVTALTRARELLLPILVFPLVVPVVISAVKATTLLFVPAATEPPWLSLLIVFDVIFISVSTLLFQYVVEE